MKTNNSQKNIPSGWQLIPADQIFDFVKSYAFSRDNLVNNTDNKDGIGNIHYGDIHSTYFSTSIDLSKISVPMVKDINFNPDKKDFLKDGDLIMADVSEDYEGIGVTVLIHGLGDKKIVGGLHTFVMRDNKNITDKYFRQYIFRNPKIRSSLQKIANGVSVYGVSKTSLSKLFIPVPPLSEQKRIVAVFGTWDRAIKKLEKKIEIKKQVKGGLMHDLLSGEKRVPGFKDKWEELKLRDIGEIVTGSTPSKKIPDYYGDKYLWATALDFNGPYIEDTEIKLSESGKSVARMVSPGSVLVTCIASIGKNAIARKTMAFNQQINAIVPHKNYNSEFIFYLIENYPNKLKEVAGGGALAMISKSVFEKIKFTLPRLEEQTAIANILSKSDEEIKDLEKKLSILKFQKRYLLNNLITGKIRTPENLSINK